MLLALKSNLKVNQFINFFHLYYQLIIHIKYLFFQ